MSVTSNQIESYLGDANPAEFAGEREIHEYFSDESLDSMFPDDDRSDRNAVRDEVLRQWRLFHAKTH